MYSKAYAIGSLVALIVLLSVVSPKPVQSNDSIINPKIRILFTFDDGPSNEMFRIFNKRTPTEVVLDVLNKHSIKAIFFVLTTPEHITISKRFYDVYRQSMIVNANTINRRMANRTINRRRPRVVYPYRKAETQKGFNMLRRTIREGHVLGAHWGGNYYTQKKYHPNSLLKPAYDYNLDGIIDKVSEKGSLLETQLLECVDRISQAYWAEGIDYIPEFVRSPVWKYRIRNRDARNTYDLMNLKLILADAKLFDGGYSYQGYILESLLLRDIRRSIDKGFKDIILTLHDSNYKTAKTLDNTIGLIRKLMNQKMKLTEGKDWKFVDSQKEVLDLLYNKTHFMRHPDVISKKLHIKDR